MNENSSKEKMSQFNSVNLKGNWAYLAGKNSRTGAKTTTVFRLL